MNSLIAICLYLRDRLDNAITIKSYLRTLIAVLHYLMHEGDLYYNGVLWNITRVDTFEGYKADISLLLQSEIESLHHAGIKSA